MGSIPFLHLHPPPVKLRNTTWLLPTLGGHSLVLSPTHTGTRSVIIGNLGLEPYFSMVFLLQETLGWCNGKTRQRYFKFEYLIISSLLSALEDTSWALRSVIQIWMKTFSFNSMIFNLHHTIHVNIFNNLWYFHNIMRK